MTQTNNDGEKSDTPKNGEEAKSSTPSLLLPKDGEKKDASQPGDAAKTTTQKDPTVGIDKDVTLIEIKIPISLGIWKTMGFIQEIMIPTIRRIHIDKAKRQALKNNLISPPPGYRGFNPKKWFKR